MSAHSPKPWIVGEDGLIRDSSGCPIGQAFDNPDTGMEEPGCEQSDANGLLFAASPDLLEALNGLLARYTTLVDSGDCGCWNADEESEVIAARAAIARAEGRGE